MPKRMLKDEISYYVDTARGKYRVQRDTDFPGKWQVTYLNSRHQRMVEDGFGSLSSAERWIKEWSELVAK